MVYPALVQDPNERLRGLALAADAVAGELRLDIVLEAIVEAASHATGARYAALGVLGDDETITQFVNRGFDEETVAKVGELPKGHGLLGLLIREPRMVRTDDITSHPASHGFPTDHPPMDSFLGAPVRSRGRVFGNLYLTEKPGGFDERDEELIAVLAAQAGTAIENAELADRLQSVAVADERDRISRELHDGAIQALFSIGMGLESARGLVRSDPARVDERLDAAVDALDGVIRELRNYIFQLRPGQAASMGLERGLAELAREHEANALVRPSLDVSRDLDASVPESLVPDLLQIVREALSNVAKHADASHVSVTGRCHDQHVEIAVTDDGAGFAPGNARVGRGLDNISDRAQVLGAGCEVDSSPGAGTTVRVRVPIAGA